MTYDDATRQFINFHRFDDVRALALQTHRYPDVDMSLAIQQIAGWQKAQVKLPTWAACDQVLYPPHLALEQCSSERTARYKAQICRRLLQQQEEGAATPPHPQPTSLIADLTGGLGVDFFMMAPLFQQRIYIERQEQLCQCARHNFSVLGLDHAEVICGDALEQLHLLPHTTLLFIDPARRDLHGSRTYAISDCTPDILPILPQLLDKTDYLMVKLSPMLDWHQTIRSLETACPHSVRELHIVATGNECKELLVVLRKGATQPVTITCVNDDDIFVTDLQAEQQPPLLAVVAQAEEAKTAACLLEPNATIMKAGCFATLAQRYPIKALSDNSHLFVAQQPLDGFPGRQWRILRTTTLNKRQLSDCLQGIRQANITVRNFPMTVAELRKRLRLADGGDIYLIASTIGKHEHLIFVCSKI